VIRQSRLDIWKVLADAIIAATAEAQQANLVTLNNKHFQMLKDVVVPYQKA
jgi:hypothetical protein